MIWLKILREVRYRTFQLSQKLEARDFPVARAIPVPVTLLGQLLLEFQELLELLLRQTSLHEPELDTLALLGEEECLCCDEFDSSP